MFELPGDFFQPLENTSLINLVFSGNICNISQNVLSDMTSLQILDVSDTKMTSLDAANLIGGLKNASGLHSLIMDRVFNIVNVNSTIHKHFFHSLGSLKELSFKVNPYAFNGLLQHRLFKPIRNLLRLDLDSCGLHGVHSDAFYGLKHLKYLSLRGNFLTCYDKAACGFISENNHKSLSSLEILDLSHNNINLYDHDLSFRGSVFTNLQ
jgi:Leucine-rich repeat (LRR) protein